MREYIYEEIKNKKLLDFDNLTKHNAVMTAKSLADRMRYINNEKDLDEILFKPYHYEHFDK